MPSIHMSPAERQALLGHDRRSADPEVRLRAHVLLLDGHSRATIAAVLFCSVSTIGWWKRRFEGEGVGAVLGRPRGRRLSRVDAAERSGVHAVSIARSEAVVGTPTIATLVKLADAYWVDVYELLAGCKPAEKKPKKK
jgi:transposase